MPRRLPLQAEALRIAREHNLLVPLLFGLFAYGLTLTGKGDYDEALAMFEEGLVLSEKVGAEVLRHRLLNSLGWLYIELGDLDRAIDLNRQGAEGARKRGDPEMIANAELNLGDIFLAQGDLPWPRSSSMGSIAWSHDPATSEWMRWRYSIHLFASLGELWLARGDLTKARGVRRAVSGYSPHAPTRGSIWSRVGGSWGRSPSPAANGTRRRGRSSRP